MTDVSRIDDLRIDETAQPRRRRPRGAAALLVAVAALAIAAYALRGRIGPTSAGPVEVFVVPTESGAAGGFTAGGYLEVIPPGATIVSVAVEGRITSLTAVEGQTVEKGQELAQLDDTQAKQEVAVREAALALARSKLARQEAGFRPEEIVQARAELDRAEARLHQAASTLERMRSLGDVESKKNLEGAEADLAAAKAEVSLRKAEVELRTNGYRKEDIEIARREVALTESELERAKWRLGACRVVAPVSGVVLEHFAQPGDWLSPSDRTERRGAILSLVDPRKIQAWVDVNQRDIAQVSVGQPVVLATDADPRREIRGRVARLLPKANLQKNTVQVKVEIPEPPAELRPDMSVKVRFLPAGSNANAPRAPNVPARAIVRDGPRTGVFLLEGNVARFRSIVVDESGAIRSGVSPGDTVLLDVTGISDGQTVQRK